ncbi:MAG TPA: outer membrane beta-barrel protein [Steroidobacteraceae bacterium]
MSKARVSFRWALCPAIVASGLVSPAAFADDGGFYVGGTFGRLISTYSRDDLNAQIDAAFGGTESGFTLNSTLYRKNHLAWSGNVGYMVSPNLGIEASYLSLGSLDYSAAGTVASANPANPASAVNVDVTLKSSGPALAVVGVLPMSNIWSVNARLGAYEGKTKTGFVSTVDTDSTNGKESDSSTSVMGGVGATVAVTNFLLIRVDYLRIQRLKDNLFERTFNVNVVTAGLEFAF